MTARTKLSRQQQEAIAALLTSRTVEEAARVAGISTQKLSRWMDKDPAFIAAHLAARRAGLTQVKARIRHGAAPAVASMLKTMMDVSAPASTRLEAATLVISYYEDAIALEALGAEVAEVERARKASPTGGNSRIAGHGTKFGRRKELAIAALLSERNIAEAARVAGIGTPTMYRWIGEPEFQAGYAAAGSSVFRQAMRHLQPGLGAAGVIIRNFNVDQSIPAATRLKAGKYILSENLAFERETLDARLTTAETATGNAENKEPARTSKIIGKDLHRRVQRLKGLLLQSHWPRMRIRLVHAIDGRAAGPTSVIEPDGRHPWLIPPAGSKEGEPAPVQGRKTDRDPFPGPRVAA